MSLRLAGRYAVTGHPVRALAAYAEALGAVERLGDVAGCARILREVSALLHELGRPADAQQLYERVLASPPSAGGHVLLATVRQAKPGA